jgi:AAA15 family ATPase/GTPase
MKYIDFRIQNFKGIHDLHFALDSQPDCNIFPLVGLNESGKTTVLEALNFFQNQDKYVDAHDLIPITSRDNFNSDIKVSAQILLLEEDIQSLTAFAKKDLNISLEEASLKKAFTISWSFSFINSKMIKKTPTWTFHPCGTKGRGKKVQPLTGPDWQSLYAYLNVRLPKILYFPTFLFDFSDRIYLEGPKTTSTLNTYFKEILQDILDSLDNDLDLTKHVLDRIVSNDRNDKRSLNAVLLRMGQAVTQEVFGTWNQTFNKKLEGKEVIFREFTDDQENISLELVIKDRDGEYLVKERSLGFRWFFCFQLFIRFRAFRRQDSKNVLFLLDEPASNLHSTAQSQLLKCFEKVAVHDCKIIYSTHSHHMINPLWLEGAYIVKNSGLDYQDDIADFHARKTDVTIQKYKTFVGDHPDQTTYFQPILDCLDYKPSNIENVPRLIMVEGKNDFYTLSYFNMLLKNSQLNILPGNGASGLDLPIKLYLGWGRPFIVLLDSDEEAKNNKVRYVADYALAADKILTLEDVNPVWRHISLDKLFSVKDILALQGSDAKKLNKKRLYLKIHELLAGKTKFEFESKTLENFEMLLEFLQNQFEKSC